jgi:hypothetical protein
MNTTITSPTIASILTTTNIHNINSINNSNNSLKRKRGMKTVQFDLKVTVLETYSKEEYDRSDIFSSPILYKINPNILRSTPQLSLDIPTPNLIEEGEEGSSGGEEEISSAEISPNTPPTLNTKAAVNDEYFTSQHQKKKQKKQRPILSVNTNMCADPLFFTSLSTNYKNDTNSATTNDDFLVPISATVL